MEENEKITKCEACTKIIAKSAASCPSCGAKNAWIHPRVEHFLTIKDGILDDAFNYEYNHNILYCHRTKKNKIYQIKIMHIGLAMTVIAMVLMYIDMEFAMLVMCVGVAVGGFGTVIGGANIESDNYIKFTFAADGTIYESNDDSKWGPLIVELSS